MKREMQSVTVHTFHYLFGRICQALNVFVYNNANMWSFTSVDTELVISSVFHWW